MVTLDPAYELHRAFGTSKDILDTWSFVAAIVVFGAIAFAVHEAPKEQAMTGINISI